MLTSPIPSLGDFKRSGEVEMNREEMRTVGVRGEARAMSLVERSIVECCISMWSVERLIEVKKEVAEERKSIELLSIAPTSSKRNFANFVLSASTGYGS